MQIPSFVHRRCHRRRHHCRFASLHDLRQQFLLQVFLFIHDFSSSSRRRSSFVPPDLFLLPIIWDLCVLFGCVSRVCVCLKHNRILFTFHRRTTRRCWEEKRKVYFRFFFAHETSSAKRVCVRVWRSWRRDWAKRSLIYLIFSPTTADRSVTALLTFATETTNHDKPTVRLRDRACVREAEVSSSCERRRGWRKNPKIDALLITQIFHRSAHHLALRAHDGGGDDAAACWWW